MNRYIGLLVTSVFVGIGIVAGSVSAANTTTTVIKNSSDVVEKTHCGDGTKQTPNDHGRTEQCDDGNQINGDGCNHLCVVEKTDADKVTKSVICPTVSWMGFKYNSSTNECKPSRRGYKCNKDDLDYDTLADCLKAHKNSKTVAGFAKDDLLELLPENCMRYSDGCNKCVGNISKGESMKCTSNVCQKIELPVCFKMDKVKKQDKIVAEVKNIKSSWLSPLFKQIETLQNKLKSLITKIKDLMRFYTDDSLANQATSETLTTQFTYTKNPNITVSLQQLTNPILANQEVTIRIATSSTGCAIRKADFVIDGEVVGSDATKPFEFKWKPKMGEYTVKTVVEDCQGLAAYATKKVSVVSEVDGGGGTGASDGDVDLPPEGDDDDSIKSYTKEEIAKHNKTGDCWIILDGQVFDMSEQSKVHPTMFTCGGDGTANYKRQHGETISAAQMKFKIGEMELSDNDDTVCTADAKVCPDGTSVGRTGTSCEFVCPSDNVSDISPKTELFMSVGDWDVKNLMVVMERENKSLLFIDGATHQKVGRISDVGVRVHTSVFSPSGKYAYHISRDGWLTKIALNTLQPVSHIRVGTNSRGTGLTENGAVVAVGNYDPKEIVLIDAQGMKIIKKIALTGEENGKIVNARAGAVVESGNNIIVALKDLAQVWIINASNPTNDIKVIKKITVGGVDDVLHDGYLTPDGKFFIISVQGQDTVAVIDMATMKKVAQVKTGIKPHTSTGATVGTTTFVPALGEGNITAIDTTTWQVKANIKTGGPGLFIRHYSGDTNYKYVWADTVAGDKKDEIYVIDATALKVVKTLVPVAGKKSVHPEFTLDGKFVYVAVWEASKVYVYDANTFAVVATIDAITPSGISNVGLRLEELGI